MRAVIFDLDGVLIDSMLLHFSIQRDILARFGIEYTYEQAIENAGVPFGVQLQTLLPDQDTQALNKEKTKLMMERIDSIELIPGAMQLIESLHGKVKMGIATGGRPNVLHAVVKKFGFDKYMQVYYSSDSVENPKPAPDIFMKVAEELGVPYSDCTVIEDGVSGMKGSRQAGMKVIALSSNPDAPADIRVEKLSDIDITVLI